jgi:hypothetical protein
MRDILTVVLSASSSALAAVAVVRWLARRFIEHRLAKDLKDYQAHIDSQLKDRQSQLDATLILAKAELEASWRQRVEEYLGERAAERQYQSDARKRLYTVVEPLKFQLIWASAELVNRIWAIGTDEQEYPITYKGNFGRSTLYRVLRVFGVAELLEWQMANADFTVDTSMVSLIRFKKQSFDCMASFKASLGHPDENRNEQRQRIFYDELAIIASGMIITDRNNQQRVMRFDEFAKIELDPNDQAGLFRALPHVMKDFTPTAKPLLWVRLLALASLCNELVRIEGARVGVPPEEFDGVKLLSECKDPFVRANRDKYAAMLAGIISTL